MPRNAPQTGFGPILGGEKCWPTTTALVPASERIPYDLRERHSWCLGYSSCRCKMLPTQAFGEELP